MDSEFFERVWQKLQALVDVGIKRRCQVRPMLVDGYDRLGSFRQQLDEAKGALRGSKAKQTDDGSCDGSRVGAS